MRLEHAMRLISLALVLAVGCGRIGFDFTSGDADADSGEAATSARLARVSD